MWQSSHLLGNWMASRREFCDDTQWGLSFQMEAFAAKEALQLYSIIESHWLIHGVNEST